MNTGPSQFPTVASILLDHIEARVVKAEFKELSDEDLLSLHSVFGAALRRALDILEKQPSLTVYSTNNSSRKLIEIKGDNNRCYRLFPRVNFCPCLAFKHQVLERKLQVTCKHTLAARIALILDKTSRRQVTNDQFKILLKSMFQLEE